MGKKLKRRTAAQGLKLLIDSPDLQNLSAQLRSIPTKVSELIDQQINEYRADRQRIEEANNQAFASLRSGIEPLIETLAKSKDEDSRSSVHQKIDRLVEEYMSPSTLGGTGQQSVADIADEIESGFTKMKEDYIREIITIGALDTFFLASRYEEAISAAFTAFNLDRKNPLNWRALLGFLAWTHFNDPRQKGRPPEWPSERYCLLLEHVDRIKARHPGRLSDSRACELLKKSKFSAVWKDQSAKRLNGAMAEARNPCRNRALIKPVFDECMVIAKTALASGKKMSSEEEAALIKKVARKHADEIGRRWRKDADH